MGRYCSGNGRGRWMRPAGIAIVILGLLLLVAVIPRRVWLLLLGLLLIALGLMLLRAG